jgi:dTDP-4-dehydrorhamnose 3,5-epimerase
LKTTETSLDGVILVEPDVYGDHRGFFKESFQKNNYKDIGIEYPFVQDNMSRSSKGVLRGLHFQKNNPQGKLVSCVNGSVYDVAVDIDINSNTYGEYFGVLLTSSNHLQLWIPPGYAHGFCVVSDSADFFYKCTDFYDPNDQQGIIWNDSELNIDWPISKPLISKKDLDLPTLAQMRSHS